MSLVILLDNPGTVIAFEIIPFIFSQDFNHIYTNYIQKQALTEAEVTTYFCKVKQINEKYIRNNITSKIILCGTVNTTTGFKQV